MPDDAPAPIRLERVSVAHSPQQPGEKTTEFWDTMVNKLLGVGLIAFGFFAKQPELMYVGAGMVGIGSAGYAVSRGLAKMPLTPPQ